MNSVESSTVVYSRLSALDPESASKIMGFILIHGPSETDMMSLATAPDAVLLQLISKGKSYSKTLTSSVSALHSPVSSPSGFRSNGFNTASLSPSYASVVNGNVKLSEEAGGTVDDEFETRNPKSDDELHDLGLDGHRFMDSHKRSLSLSDAGFGYRSSSGGIGCASSPEKIDGFDQEMLRSRVTQQQRLAFASQIMFGNSFPYNYKHSSDSPRSIAAAMVMGDELHKLGQLRHDLSDIAFMGCSSSSSRQIYLTFPADSTFREEDVSIYFSIYGPVQDVRIPYQQKRMFGFVTFVHPETVNIILAKGNPHFVCDSRVLVKPYKEKGKVEKKHLMMQQPLERGDLSCLSPRGVDIRDFDVRIGPRMFYNNTQDLLMKKKLEEQAEFQKALDIQSRKLACLQFLDLNNLPSRHPFSPSHNLSTSAAVSSPTRHPLLSPNHMRSMSAFNQEAFEENVTAPTLSLPPHVLAHRQMSLERFLNDNNHTEYTTNNSSENGKLGNSAVDKRANSIDPVLPDTLDDTILTSSLSLTTIDNTSTYRSQFSSNPSTLVSSACLSNVALSKSRFLDDPSFGATGGRVVEM